jgi:hypothetical protein
MLPLDPPLSRDARPTRVNPSRRYDNAEFKAFCRNSDSPGAQLRFARHLLGRDPENIWAMMILARHTETITEYMALLREAVRVGLRLWSPQLAGRIAAPCWGTDRDAAPFLGAVLAYGMALMEEGSRDEAAQCLRFLLRLDPEDHLGAVACMTDVGLVLSGGNVEEGAAALP